MISMNIRKQVFLYCTSHMFEGAKHFKMKPFFTITFVEQLK